MKTASEFFTVEGAGDFPFDMLRYDRCYPADESASARMYNDHSGRRRVELRHPVERGERWQGPTAGRWESFCWRVVA